MLHADLIDEADLCERLQQLGVQLPTSCSAEHACERALQGLDAPRARALRTMIEQLLGGSASLLPSVRAAIARQLLPALAEYQQQHG
jgi:hypothetical protein